MSLLQFKKHFAQIKDGEQQSAVFAEEASVKDCVRFLNAQECHYEIVNPTTVSFIKGQ